MCGACPSHHRRAWSSFVIGLALVAIAFLAACHRQPVAPSLVRIAVLRFENLGADPSADPMAGDWMGRAFAEIIASELSGTPGLYAIPSVRVHAIEAGLGGRPAGAPGISAERTAALAAGATKIAYGQYAIRGGTLDVRVTLEDEFTGKMTVLQPVSARPADIVSAATALAGQISTHITPYGTRNPQVVEAYVKGLEGLGNAGVAEGLEKAIAADPGFGPPYRQLAQFKARQKDVAGAQELLERALARGHIEDSERALIQLEIADLRNDARAHLDALTALAKADPYDPERTRELAAACLAAHRYPQAVEAFRKAVELQPNNVDLWNQLAYAAAYAGDGATADSALERYRKLQTQSPNPLDSLGDVNLIQGHLSAAEENYRQNAKKNPEFYAGLDFLKAALAHLMTGDVSGADGLAQQYFDARATAKDPLIEYRKAQWAWISGRRKAACRQMEQLATTSETGVARNVASHAYAELAVWTLMLGNRGSAAELARKAAASVTPASAVQVALARFLSQPPATPAEWQARTGMLTPDRALSAIGSVALADALLFSKEYSAALPVLQSMYDSGNPTADEGLPVLLAWADVETGHIAEAAALLRTNPPLRDVGLSWSTPLYFPRIFYLRAVVAEKQGKPEDARENWRIFHALSGSDALLWGEEQQAAAGHASAGVPKSGADLRGSCKIRRTASWHGARGSEWRLCVCKSLTSRDREGAVDQPNMATPS
jgi:tetratricopeptide (TPR) repeat protein